MEQLRDISGEPPQPLKNLAEIIKLRKTLNTTGVRSVTQKGETLEVMFEKTAPINAGQITYWQKNFPHIRFLKNPGGDGFVVPSEKDILNLVKKLFPKTLK